jgi:hypothetical protein
MLISVQVSRILWQQRTTLRFRGGGGLQIANWFAGNFVNNALLKLTNCWFRESTISFAATTFEFWRCWCLDLAARMTGLQHW